MYKAVVFFDLDGTLFDNQKNVSDDNIAAINQLRENNILPVISTGRNIFEIQYVIDATGINSLVSANGSYVQYQGKKLKAEQISDEVIEEILAFAKKQGDVISFYNNEEFALTAENDLTKVNYRLLRLTPHVEPDFYKTHEVNFLNVFNYDKDKLYQDEFKGELSLVRNNPRCLDTMKWGVSKQTGIQALLKKAQSGDIPSYAFGDQLNDLQMFAEVDYPVAMGNGHPDVKAKASFVTTSNVNGGIVNGLKHYGLIK
ncbi:UNVERIFIED_CONTAM: Cof-type HAD-IIB family hydrolase [Limosilactobacillus fermentum]|uniref:Cof-type HAD-IIB family hydrolase n=1 Tax=Limosilactobacillus fermentum TaxID=1613 RepID=A0AAJ5ZVT9_LIMFE|nr:Cof-type HAD-IIB family hydrolase [Limosilactobacillus fermentum]MED7636047.1 Cof-type HAD-IIB family hydrolase [Limosilactobacillus fermentum]PTS35485.1 Cof-type HAD-IIB family hydrolase [Limosilactobacillus fermentum]WFR88825.1 Cof-type HAD-IIB family hydrolase [Limosilactobacillus fermentum]